MVAFNLEPRAAIIFEKIIIAIKIHMKGKLPLVQGWTASAKYGFSFAIFVFPLLRG